ncbi:beta-ketoacyl synthase family protein [Diplonema papillatum]|nr:beta-ketoacyl synthase family protein [Diplonema papillatum]
MRRVVVTGIGCVPPLGLTAKETWAALIPGKCGLRAVEDMPGFWHTWPTEAVGLTCRVAGPVKDDRYNPNSRQSRATLSSRLHARGPAPVRAGGRIHSKVLIQKSVCAHQRNSPASLSFTYVGTLATPTTELW